MKKGILTLQTFDMQRRKCVDLSTDAKHSQAEEVRRSFRSRSAVAIYSGVGELARMLYNYT